MRFFIVSDNGDANGLAWQLMLEGNVVFSPISHTHPIALAVELPRDWEFWKAQDISFLKWCDELHVLKQDGWEESVGVQAEIRLASEMHKPIVYIEV